MLALCFFRARGLSLFISASAALLMQAGNANAAPGQVRISNLTNITVPLWITGDPTIIQGVFACVYRENNGNNNARTYAITATGDGPGFLLKSGANTLAYTVTWNDGGAANPGGGTTADMTNNVKLTNRQNARNQTDTPATNDSCNSGASPTARVRITITNTNMEAAPDGTFTGVLTLILSLT